MVVTQQEIADRLGVSRRLVGAALSGNPRVSAVTRQRVEAMAIDLGYQPNQAARALVTGRHFQVALFLPSLDGQFHSELIRQFERLARSTHYSLVILKYSENMNVEAVPSADGSVAYVMPQRCLPNLGQRPQVILRPKSYAVPAEPLAASVDEETKSMRDIVHLDMDSAVTELMEHLVTQGHKRIAIVTTAAMLRAGLPRYEAYRAAMCKAGLPPEIIELSIPPDCRWREVVDKQLSCYFEQYGYPEALVCSNDEFAIGAYRALKRVGRQIPQQTVVTGCDNIEESEDACPSLTTIDLNTELACKTAWNLLLSRLSNPDTPVTNASVPAQTIFRDSSQIAI